MLAQFFQTKWLKNHFFCGIFCASSISDSVKTITLLALDSYEMTDHPRQQNLVENVKYRVRKIIVNMRKARVAQEQVASSHTGKTLTAKVEPEKILSYHITKSVDSKRILKILKVKKRILYQLSRFYVIHATDAI